MVTTVQIARGWTDEDLVREAAGKDADAALVQLGDPFIKPALASMEANAGKFDFHRQSVRLCRFGIDACALGAAGGVFQRVLYSVEADLGAAPERAPGRRRARATAGA